MRKLRSREENTSLSHSSKFVSFERSYMYIGVVNGEFEINAI